mmetsp:Transcript_13050/g.37567  ORF Transcript_13050/g.37567 Transcript_13050/m.37567 type:complete len:239 (+) Transcript_13050:541-1257(+)
MASVVSMPWSMSTSIMCLLLSIVTTSGSRATLWIAGSPAAERTASSSRSAAASICCCSSTTSCVSASRDRTILPRRGLSFVNIASMSFFPPASTASAARPPPGPSLSLSSSSLSGAAAPSTTSSANPPSTTPCAPSSASPAAAAASAALLDPSPAFLSRLRGAPSGLPLSFLDDALPLPSTRFTFSLSGCASDGRLSSSPSESESSPKMAAWSDRFFDSSVSSSSAAASGSGGGAARR